MTTQCPRCLSSSFPLQHFISRETLHPLSCDFCKDVPETAIKKHVFEGNRHTQTGQPSMRCAQVRMLRPVVDAVPASVA